MNKCTMLTTLFILSLFVSAQAQGQSAQAPSPTVQPHTLAVTHVHGCQNSCDRPVIMAVKGVLKMARSGVCRTGRAVRKTVGGIRCAARNTLRGGARLTKKILNRARCRLSCSCQL